MGVISVLKDCSKQMSPSPVYDSDNIYFMNNKCGTGNNVPEILTKLDIGNSMFLMISPKPPNIFSLHTFICLSSISKPFVEGH